MRRRFSGVWLPIVTPFVDGEIKHCLWRAGLIPSPECRLPMTRVSPALAHELEKIVCDVADAEVRR